MYLWPLLAQNKVRDSKVLDLLKNMVNKEEEESIKELAEKVRLQLYSFIASSGLHFHSWSRSGKNYP